MKDLTHDKICGSRCWSRHDPRVLFFNLCRFICNHLI